MSRYDEIILEHYGFNATTICNDAREEQKREDEALYGAKVRNLEQKITLLNKLLEEHGIQVPAEA